MKYYLNLRIKEYYGIFRRGLLDPLNRPLVQSEYIMKLIYWQQDLHICRWEEDYRCQSEASPR